MKEQVSSLKNKKKCNPKDLFLPLLSFIRERPLRVFIYARVHSSIRSKDEKLCQTIGEISLTRVACLLYTSLLPQCNFLFLFYFYTFCVLLMFLRNGIRIQIHHTKNIIINFDVIVHAKRNPFL